MANDRGSRIPTYSNGHQLTCDAFHVVDLRPADVEKVLAVRIDSSRLEVIYFLYTMVL